MGYIPPKEYYSAIKKGMYTDLHCNMNKPWKHYAKWKKPITKGHML